MKKLQEIKDEVKWTVLGVAIIMGVGAAVTILMVKGAVMLVQDRLAERTKKCKEPFTD